MDITQLASALLAIVVIDLVLAGDNAIVIALAARSLPPQLQRRAIIWGTVGAIVVRSAMTVAVVWLLTVPGLRLAGGLLLVWIAYRLLLPEPARANGNGHAAAATGFWGAMRTIVIADAVMGLDNVLAVAGASHGNPWLVITGLLISVPIVVWGSTMVLSLIERFPVITYAGAAVLVATAIAMLGAEPLLEPWWVEAPALRWLLWLALPLVLWAGFAANHRVAQQRMHTRLAELQPMRPSGEASPQPEVAAERRPLRVLVPVDGEANALGAVRHAIGEYRRLHDLELHLLNVQRPLARHAARFLARGARAAWHAERAAAALAEARRLLDAAGVPHHEHHALGERAAEICRVAAELGVHHIVMGSARKNSLTRMLEDSVTSRVLEHTPVPVEVVSGAAVSKWERWGLPAGVLATGGLMLMALD